MRLKSWMKRAVGAKKITTASKHCYVQLPPYPRGELQKYQAALALERASASLTTRTRSLSGACSIRATVFAPPTLSGPGPDNPGSPPAHRRFSRPRVACPGLVAPSSPHHYFPHACCLRTPRQEARRSSILELHCAGLLRLSDEAWRRVGLSITLLLSQMARAIDL